MSDTAPKKRFNQAIELAKLQAKITDFQTGHYAASIFIFTLGTSVLLAMLAIGMQTTNPQFFLAGFAGALILSGFGYWFMTRGRKSEDAKLRKDFERIYNEEPIDP